MPVGAKWSRKPILHSLPDGRILTTRQISDITGLSPDVIRTRIRNKWTFEEILNTPSGYSRPKFGIEDEKKRENKCKGCEHWRTSGLDDADRKSGVIRYCNYMFDTGHSRAFTNGRRDEKCPRMKEDQ